MSYSLDVFSVGLRLLDFLHKCEKTWEKIAKDIFFLQNCFCCQDIMHYRGLWSDPFSSIICLCNSSTLAMIKYDA